jgi:hypothetical protein
MRLVFVAAAVVCVLSEILRNLILRDHKERKHMWLIMNNCTHCTVHIFFQKSCPRKSCMAGEIKINKEIQSNLNAVWRESNGDNSLIRLSIRLRASSSYFSDTRPLRWLLVIHTSRISLAAWGGQNHSNGSKSHSCQTLISCRYFVFG